MKASDKREMAPAILNYINGEWREASAGQTEPSVNPANRLEVVGYLQRSGLADLEHAVTAARTAQQAWKKLSGFARGEYLYKAAQLLEERADEIAAMMTREMGKTLAEAKGEAARGVAILRFYAGEGIRKIGDVIPSADSEALMFTTRVPLGVVGIITPWNFPVATPLWKIAPALVYGNAVVFKPAQETGATAAKVVECFADAGFPPGVINLIMGSGSVIGQGIVEHPGIQAISFTGSEQVGKAVGQGALARGAKYQLEMGGKNPIIILEDADLDAAVTATVNGGLRSTGQKCTATSRVIVQRSIYEEFRNKLLAKVKEIKLGNGLDEETWMGPCSSEKQMHTVLSYIQKGTEEGAALLYGGERAAGEEVEQGFYVQPTVFENVTPQMTIAQEEIFGPVLALLKVDTLEDAIELANRSQYGLSASIFTKDIGNVLAFIQDIESGMVRINAETAGVELQAPFGGMKQSSSHSREQGQAAIEFYTSVKTVLVKA